MAYTGRLRPKTVPFLRKMVYNIKWYIGVGPRGGASPCKNLLSTPPPPPAGIYGQVILWFYCNSFGSFLRLYSPTKVIAACAVVHQQSFPTSYILASADCIIANNRLIIGQALINSCKTLVRQDTLDQIDNRCRVCNYMPTLVWHGWVHGR